MNIEKSFSQAGLAEKFLREFRSKHGRSPCVLHIGNIANNAYLNAKFLNKAGFDCDVLCYDYYHIMACPEWEDADYTGVIEDQNKPDWAKINLNGFQRPLWFAQGPLVSCLDYLVARRTNDATNMDKYWRELSIANKTLTEVDVEVETKTDDLRQSFLSRLIGYIRFIAIDESLLQRLAISLKIGLFNNYRPPLGHIMANVIIIGILLFSTVCKIALMPYYLLRRTPESPEEIAKKHEEQLPVLLSTWENKWKTLFEKTFPNRNDRLQIEDIIGYYDSIPKLKHLFSHYDLVQGYATDGIFALLTEFPYVAYEHGTIRSTPFQESSQGRLCAMTYKLADYVCVTNADNIVAADALGLEHFIFVPHPINEGMYYEPDNQLQHEEELHLTLNSDFLVFHPARHHWDDDRHPNWEKGNDIFIRGFARFVKEINTNAKAIFVEWGNTVDKSKLLIKKLGIVDNIVWIQPQTANGMARYILSTDLLADQFYLGAFGSTLPRALACGKPAMICLNIKLHEWCFQEMPPVLNACDENSVFNGLVTVYHDKDWVKDNADKGRMWYQRFHSSEVIVNKLCTVYKSVLLKNNATIN